MTTNRGTANKTGTCEDFTVTGASNKTNNQCKDYTMKVVSSKSSVLGNDLNWALDEFVRNNML